MGLGKVALAGSDVLNRGAAFGMFKYRPFSGFSTVVMDYQINDFLNTGFGQVEYTSQGPKDQPNWAVGANIIDQRTVGADLLTGGSFRTYQASTKAQVTHVGWTLFVVSSITGDQS